jgi:hypothetical protein
MEDKKASIIQTYYLFNKSVERFKNDFLSKIKELTFEELKILITNKDIIDTSYILLKNCQKWLFLTYPYNSKLIITKSKVRILLSSILIHYFPKEILGEEYTLCYQSMILIKKNKLLQVLLNLMLCRKGLKSRMNLFMDNFQKYIDVFLEWQKYDKENLISKMAQNYWELEITKREINDNDEQSEAILRELNNTQTTILVNIQRIDSINGMNMFNSYIPIVFTNDFMYNVRSVLENAFWDVIREEMSQTPVKTIKFKVLLEELEDNLKNICLSDNEYQNNILEYYDIILLLEMIKYGSYTLNDALKHWNTLVDILIRYDAPVNDIENSKLKEDIGQSINSIFHQDLSIFNKSLESWILILNTLLPRMNSIIKIKNMLLNELNEE